MVCLNLFEFSKVLAENVRVGYLPFLRNTTTTAIAATAPIDNPIAMYIVGGSSGGGVGDGEGEAVGVSDGEGEGVEEGMGVGFIVGLGEGEGDTVGLGVRAGVGLG